MSKSENPFRILYDRAYDYFSVRIARRVFFFSIIAVFLCAILMQIKESTFTTCLLLAAATICAFSTMVDSIQSKHEFVQQLKDMEAAYINRVFEKHGEEGLSTMKGAFSLQEIAYTRKKKREYNFMILIKFIFIVIFVVLFFNML